MTNEEISKQIEKKQEEVAKAEKRAESQKKNFLKKYKELAKFVKGEENEAKLWDSIATFGNMACDYIMENSGVSDCGMDAATFYGDNVRDFVATFTGNNYESYNETFAKADILMDEIEEHIEHHYIALRKKATNEKRIAELEATKVKNNEKDNEYNSLPECLRNFLEDAKERTIKYYMERHDHGKSDKFYGYPDEDVRRIIEKDFHDRGLEIAFRVKARCGKITNAENLSIGMNGTVNGTIEGEKGTAEVETIIAGGYNIQCEHFRVLVK